MLYFVAFMRDTVAYRPRHRFPGPGANRPGNQTHSFAYAGGQIAVRQLPVAAGPERVGVLSQAEGSGSNGAPAPPILPPHLVPVPQQTAQGSPATDHSSPSPSQPAVVVLPRANRLQAARANTPRKRK
jgi:hypothetical protein